MQPIVKFCDVSKKYNQKVVLDKINFTLYPSEIATMVGPNGAGKSTVAKLILGIEKPTSGQIEIHTNNIAYIPQKMDLNSTMSIEVNQLIKYISGGKNIDDAQIEIFAEIKSIGKMQAGHLSGGQLQRVLLAANLLRKPQLIVLDEPTQGLDIKSQQEFYSLIENIRYHYHTSIFMISHDLYAVMKTSDQVLCLNNHICCSGKPDKNSSNSDLENIALYTHHHDHNHS